MKFTRVLSHGKCPVERQVAWKKVDVQVEDMRTGAAIFEQADVEVPEQWSDHAASILSQKYFRKAGVPARAQYHQPHPHDPLMPKWLHPSLPVDGCSTGGETSARQVFHRLAGAWTYHGWLSGIFCKRDRDQAGGTILGTVQEADENARIFYDELYLCLANQIAAPNSPQWFNTGLWWAYGIEGNDSGMWVCDDGTPRRINTSYVRPQPHACFLTSVEDDLVNPGGIMDAWVREARIFKHGSGSGMNVSGLRAKGELLAGGGKSSGVMSWLRIGDSAAGAIQSGGTTRRAAVMRIMDDDHPEVEAFIDWKVREENKAAAMHVGSRMLRECEEDLPEHFVPQQVRDRLENGFEQEVFGIGWEEEANRTIDGQNSNNSVRVTEHFMQKASRRDEDADWSLTARTTGATMKVIDARDLWDTICRAAWASADPGLLFHDTINAWNTSAADGVIRTTNPCAEFHHLDGSACNLASMRLTAFLRDDSSLDLTLFQHVCRLFTVVLDVSVSMASFPAEEFALGAWRYRTLGLGYADLGALLMRMAFPYDSTPGRALAAALTSLMTGVAYKTSAEMAAEIGPFPRWEANTEPMRRVLRNHARTAGLTKERIEGAEHDEYEGLNYFPAQINHMVSKELNSAIQHVWVDVCSAESFRNAQVTLLAPTGTISFVMDCDTTGVESDLGLVKYKNLAGGGSMKIVNQSVACSLTTQGFSSALITEIVRYVEEYGTVEDCPAIPVELRSRAYAVFECSNPAPGFSRCLRWEAHVEMLAAVQPHLSGAASKTINMPATATVEDVSAAYMMAWKLGVKAVALYRDGCKLSQPLQTTPITAKRDVPVVQLAERAAHNGVVAGSSPAGHTTSRGAKEHLPWRRERGYTQKAKIGDQTLFWRVSEYPDGRPGEIFIELAHEGSTMRAIANSVAIAMSVALQHGTPITEMIDKFLYVKFEPAGYVEGHPHVKFATSIFDLIAKDLAITYLGRDDLKAEQSHVAIDDPEKVVALDRRALAAAGSSLTGDPCPACGGLLRRTGTCRTCTNCAWNEGCG